MTELDEKTRSTDPADWPVFSYSQLSVWDRCEFSWHLGYGEKWVQKAQPAYMNKGSLIHEMMDVFYSSVRQAGYKNAVDLLDEFISSRINEMMTTDDSALSVLSQAAYVSKRYVNEFVPKEDAGFTILSSEHHFTVPFKTASGRNFIIQGYIDVLAERAKRLWAWDHKSSESAQFWTPTEVQMDPQMPVYSLCLREQGFPVHGTIINQFNTYPYKDMAKVDRDKLFKRESVYRTDKELDNVLKEVRWMVDDLVENHTTPRRSLRRDCKRCQFNEACLMDLKGIDPAPFLMDKFVRKEEYDVPLDFTPERIL
jgi:CRISPR/Cas system-associated exonuclease Cas4 (RecB family)